MPHKRPSSSFLRTAVAGGLLMVALAGCTQPTKAPEPTRTATSTPTVKPTRTPTPTISATPTVTPEATPAPTVTPEVLPQPAPPVAEAPAPAPAAPVSTDTCENVLTDTEYALLEADGLRLTEELYIFEPLMQSIVDDGFGCHWNRSGGDVRVWYAQAPRSEAAWAQQEQELLASGWTRIDAPVSGTLEAPAEDYPNEIPSVVYKNGVLHYSSYAPLLGSIRALQ